MNFARKALILCAALVSLQAAAAPVVSWTTQDNHAYAKTNGFESTGALATNTMLTNQFAAAGIVFSDMARANGCGANFFASEGLVGNYVSTLRPVAGCSTNTMVDTLTMKFGGDISRLAIDAIAQTEGNGTTVQLFNDGNLVGSYGLGSLDYEDLAQGGEANIGDRVFSSSGHYRAGILLIDSMGSAFDELRFVESAAGARQRDYVAFDNLRYDAASTVPEPTSLALVTLALVAGGGTLRAKRRKA